MKGGEIEGCRYGIGDEDKRGGITYRAYAF